MAEHTESAQSAGPLAGLRRQASIAVKSWELYASAVVAAAAWIAVGVSRSLERSTILPTILVGYSALGVAVIAVVLTALAIVVASLGDDHYAEVLDQASGLDDAIDPFKHCAYVSGGAVVAGLACLFVWEVSDWARPGAFAVGTFFALWSALGAVSLVSLVAFHGLQRGELALIIRESRRQLTRIGDDDRRKSRAGETGPPGPELRQTEVGR